MPIRTLLLALAALPLLAEPRLLLNRDDIARVRRTAEREPWAAAARDEVLRHAAEWPHAHVREYGLKEWGLPSEGAGWSHAYVCPVHGMRLKQAAGRNLCPVDGKDYHGWPVDNCVYMMRHGDTARALRDLGLAWQLTAEPQYVEKARTILNAYADLYPTLPIHDNDNRRDTVRGARVMAQTLSEAGWLVPLAFGYDLVRDAVPAPERARFETNVLRNAAAVIARYNAGRSNWQSHHNAALLAVGLVVGDQDLVELALDGPGGFKFQMRESITADGPWFEGAWGYHFFALAPLLATREMAARAAITLSEAAALKKMLDAPLGCLFPDGTLPNFNDASIVSIAGDARLYDQGYRIFGDPRYAAVVRMGNRGIESWLWGAPELPAGQTAPLESAILRSAGVATLRAKGSDYTLAIKFGPHGGGHGHFDKLSFVSYALAAQQAADPGTQAYAAPTHTTWDRTTVAHNTITVDEKTQAEATGQLLDWDATPERTRIRLAARSAYPGVTLERTIVHTARYTLDVFDVRSSDGQPHRFDWLYHNYGAVSSALALGAESSLPRAHGYQHLSRTRSARTAEAWQASFQQPRSYLRVWMLGAPRTTVVLGEAPGPDLRVPVPFVMARREGLEARFVALYEPYAERPRVQSLREIRPGLLEVRTAQGVEEISVGR